MQDFENRLQSVKGRSLPVWGEIDAVKPNLLQSFPTPNRLILRDLSSYLKSVIPAPEKIENDECSNEPVLHEL